MSLLHHLIDKGQHLLEGRPALAVWYHPEFRLPLVDLRDVSGLEPRRADYAMWGWYGMRLRHRLKVMSPERISYRQMALVHGDDYLESLSNPAKLATVFGLYSADFPVDAVMNTIRLGAGATLEASRYVLEHGTSALCTLGGFHHAQRHKGSGLCPINDIAIAIAVLRQEGFEGRVLVIDLDAHPPDGLADCLQDDPAVHIASLSGSDWGELPDVDETVLPPNTNDTVYMHALMALLFRTERPDLAYVIAGGDVLEEDRFGQLGLSEAGAMARDRFVFDWLKKIPTVWLPGGGYRGDSWRVLAGTGLVLMQKSQLSLPETLDPMRVQFAKISRSLTPEALGISQKSDELFTAEEADLMLSGGIPRSRLLLDYYTTEGLEHALYRYGVFSVLRSIGYSNFHVELDRTGVGDRVRVFGYDDTDREHLLLETVLAIRFLGDDRFLFINWMTLRHPLGEFGPGRDRLPGQEVPGLGMAREAANLLMLIASRLDLAGIMARPAYFHTAFIGAKLMQFHTLQAQAEFQALVRDLMSMGVVKLSEAIQEGRVLRNGEPWKWPAAPMVRWKVPHPHDPEEVAHRAGAITFTLGSEPAA